MSREREGGRRNMFGSFRSIFMHADRVDMFLMVLGFIAAICDGLSTPLLTFVMCRLMNNVGNASSLPVDVFTHQLYNVIYALVFLSLLWIIIFLSRKWTYIEPGLLTQIIIFWMTECGDDLVPCLYSMDCCFPRWVL